MYAGQQHVLMSVIGHAGQGKETWQFGLRWENGGAAAQPIALQCAPVIESWWKSTGPWAATGAPKYAAPPTHTLSELKIALIQPNGLYATGSELPSAEPASYSHFYIPEIPGPTTSSSGPANPLQDALAISLLTGFPRGLAARGRVYLPRDTVNQIGQDGRLSTGVALNMAKNFKLLLDTLNALPLVTNIAVFSKGKGVPRVVSGRKVVYDYPTVGVTRTITGVRVGCVVDTIRSRRRSLAEEYQTAP